MLLAPATSSAPFLQENNSMNCVSPPALDDRQLLGSLDGEDDSQVAFHLAHCSYCRARAAQLSSLQNQLTARLYRLTCPSPVELGDYHLGLLPIEQRRQVAAHLLECPHCAGEYAQLITYLRELAPAAEAGLVDRVKVIVARLVGDGKDARLSGAGGLAPAFAMLRGDVQGPITLQADGILIMLVAQPAEGAHSTILGQIAADEQDLWTEASVELWQGETQLCAATVDDLGAFHCENIPLGECELRIKPLSGPMIQANFELTG
jgi:anti-sigma factor RsiW